MTLRATFVDGERSNRDPKKSEEPEEVPKQPTSGHHPNPRPVPQIWRGPSARGPGEIRSGCQSRAFCPTHCLSQLPSTNHLISTTIALTGIGVTSSRAISTTLQTNAGENHSSGPGLMIPRLSRIIQTGLNQFYRKGAPDPETMVDDRKYPKRKLLPYIPEPPAEGCPINSLPPEILACIFVVGQQMDLGPEPTSSATGSGSESGNEHDDATLPHGDPVTHSVPSDRGTETLPPLEPIPVVDDENSDWEDEDTERDGDSGIDNLSVDSVLVDNSFQVTVSHVCKHWREVALETPALWSDIDLETGRHAPQSYRRASMYLSRSKGYPLSIYLEVNEWDEDRESVYSEESDYQSPITNVQLQEIVDLLLPHISRWRTLRLNAEHYIYFHTVLSRLSEAPPAPLLEHLELNNLEETLDSDHLFFPYPNHKTPFVLFDNSAPKLQHASLYGVHIDWHGTAFLKNLHSLELAYLSQDVRPSFDEFFSMLRSSPELRTLELCMAGPFLPPHEWPTFLPPPPQDHHYHDPHIPASFAPQSNVLDEYMTLPKLHELKLAYQSPEDLIAFFNRVSMPALHILELNFEDFEYTDFVQSSLIAPPKWQGGSSRESRLINLKEFRIIQLPCTPKAIAELYTALTNLETIYLDFDSLDAPFWEVLVPMKVRGVLTPAKLLLPALHTMKVKGSSGYILRQIVDARIDAGLPLKKLFIDFGTGVDKEDDIWLRENVEEVEYFEDSEEDDFSDDDESVSSIIGVEIDGFPL